MAKKQPRRKHVPQRTCVICRKKYDKRQLTRLVRTPEGVVIDPSGKLNGRGAYVCDQQLRGVYKVFLAVVESQALDRALRAALSEEDRMRLRASLLPHPG